MNVITIYPRFEDIKDKVVYKIVNTEANKELLRNIPSVPFLDLSLIFYYQADKQDSFALITNEMVDLWQVSQGNLLRLAQDNTPKILGLSINGIISEISIRREDDGLLEIADIIDDMFPMVVVSNKMKFNGASYMTDMNILKVLANKIKSDLYIIPCSIHEIIIFPMQEDGDENYMKSLIKNVNSTELPANEVLSDNLYRFSRETGKVEIA